jgi:membrane peptidoglycan carboxypeptidase
MESNRRFRRPPLVVRAVRKLRAKAASYNYGRPRSNRPQKNLLNPPHLALVTEAPEGIPPTPAEPPEPPVRRPRRTRTGLILVALVLVFILAGWAVHETRTSTQQARYFSNWAKQMTFAVGKGPTSEVRYPSDSPYDERLGYANLPQYLSKLQSRNYEIVEQARMSKPMIEAADMGFYPTYREKTSTGLNILDCRQQPLFTTSYPERTYANFDAAPLLLVKSLLFIENRELLDPAYPKRNPAVEWDRLSKAVFDKGVHTVAGGGKRVAGGSTLATQIEKYRHSPEGRTGSMKEKLTQMVSASLRAYQGGANTTEARRRIVVDYLNTVPLSAKIGYGEVNGIGDGMWVWYGRDFDAVNKALNGKMDDPESVLVFKEALSLMIAQRRPSHYLGAAGGADLETLTNSHLRLLASDGAISAKLRDAALKANLRPAVHSGVMPLAANAFVTRKASSAVRTHLAGLLGDSRLYNLDRLDLSVSSTLDADAQRVVTNVLRDLRDPQIAAAAGLTGKHLLGAGDPAKVVYSFTLLEKGEQGNMLRIQTDNFDQPLDINEGAKLDLGSTSKLRTLVTYLDIVDQLFKKYSGMPSDMLSNLKVDPGDKLSRWALDYLAGIPDLDQRKLPDMLNAALDRQYSASPGESFFTGGGLHTFGNFKKEDNSKVMPIREALRHSVNLPFVRLMRDVVHFYMFSTPGSSATLLANANDPRRVQYLMRFADKEGREFMTRFYQKYRGKKKDELEKTLLASLRETPSRLAAVHRTIAPNATVTQFGRFINDNLDKNEVPDERIAAMYEQYSAANMSLADRGYVARVHPLELWMVGYLRNNEGAKFEDVVKASANERQEVYKWLFSTHRKHAQDKRIKGLLEVEGFLEIHRQWKKMGYPFETLVPSFATALGASADRPSALAEMMGIIVNGGVRRTTQRIESLHFAKATPYETRLKPAKAQAGEQVLSPEVARAIGDAIRDVVAEGTARRVKNAFTMADGSVIPVGGKTGTGDQRFDVYAPGGRLLESRYVNRSATFVFNIGERWFGSITAYVHGPRSEDYDFTSALPVQLLTTLAPALLPMIDPSIGRGPQGTKVTSATPMTCSR